MAPIIVLLTDFGTTDPYVGVMKGVMLGICPGAQLIDLTHAIEPQNVKEAAFTLLNNVRYFPAGTTFMVVVDPGVGSSRKAIVVRSGDYTFIAPDNGVLSYTLRELGAGHAFELSNPAYQLSRMSATFHGRDVFAPAAAHAAAGVSLEQFGSPVNQPVTLPDPVLAVEGMRVTGEVLHVDHFGTAVTSIGGLRWATPDQLVLVPRFGDGASLGLAAASVVVTVRSQTLKPIRHTYAEVARGEALALVGSSGYLELSINQGSFAAQYGVGIGDAVELQVG